MADGTQSVVLNRSLTASTETKIDLPSNIRCLTFKARDAATVIAYGWEADSTVNGPYMTLPAGAVFNEDVEFSSSSIWVNASANDVIEIEAWIR
jgi:hypothetical protein